MLEMITNLVLIPVILCGICSLAASRTVRFSSPLLTIGVIGGFALSYVGFTGIPPFPPASSVQKLFYAPVIAGLLLILVHAVGSAARERLLPVLAALAALAGGAWVLQRLLGRLDAMEWLLVAALIGSVGVAFVTSLRGAVPSGPVRVAHGAVAVGLGLALIFGGTATTGFYSVALGLAIGATLLTELGNRASTAGLAISAAFLVTITPLAAQTLLLTDVSPWALLPLPACYLAIPAAQRLGWSEGTGLATVLVNSVKTAVIAFPPALAGAGISFAMGGGSPY